MVQKISGNLEFEKQPIKKKHLRATFPYNFIQSAFNSYQQKCEYVCNAWSNACVIMLLKAMYLCFIKSCTFKFITINVL